MVPEPLNHEAGGFLDVELNEYSPTVSIHAGTGYDNEPATLDAKGLEMLIQHLQILHQELTSR